MDLALAALAVAQEHMALAIVPDLAAPMVETAAPLRVEHRVLDKALQQDALGIPCCTLVAVVVALLIALVEVLVALAVAVTAVHMARQGHSRVHQTELRTPEVAAVA